MLSIKIKMIVKSEKDKELLLFESLLKDKLCQQFGLMFTLYRSNVYNDKDAKHDRVWWFYELEVNDRDTMNPLDIFFVSSIFNLLKDVVEEIDVQNEYINLLIQTLKC